MEHIKRIVGRTASTGTWQGLPRRAALEEIRANGTSLSIPLYVPPVANGNGDGAIDKPPPRVIAEWEASSQRVWQPMDQFSALLIYLEQPSRK